MQRATRMKRELEMLEREPPHGVSCWLKNADKTDQLEAQIIGGDDTPYRGGVFKLDIQLSDRYPFEPPKMRFLTPIYHPNIDTAGRICLDLLKMPPAGAWKPALNLATLLKSVQLLMADPNPDDPLMADISSEFKYNRPLFTQKAKQWTEQHASQNSASTMVTKAAGQEMTKVDQLDQVKGQSLEMRGQPRSGDKTEKSSLEGKHPQSLLSRKRKVRKVTATGQENGDLPSQAAKHSKSNSD